MRIGAADLNELLKWWSLRNKKGEVGIYPRINLPLWYLPLWFLASIYLDPGFEPLISQC